MESGVGTMRPAASGGRAVRERWSAYRVAGVGTGQVSPGPRDVWAGRVKGSTVTSDTTAGGRARPSASLNTT
jgi:hypothetical protein